MNSREIEALRKKIMVIYSPGGGNGKSEIAANLAFSFAQQGKKTWILDTNLFTPAQDIIFEVSQENPSLSGFLTDPAMQGIPVIDLSSCLGGNAGGRLFLTIANRTDPEMRFRLHELLNSGVDFSDRLITSLLTTMQSRDIDCLIIDTYPSFEKINEIWLGLTATLVIISRINDIDLKNVRMLLRQENVEEISRKIVVFNNIRLDKNHNARKALEDRVFLERITTLRQNAEHIINSGDCHEDPDEPLGCVEMYKDPILYSEHLATFRQTLKRNGLFIQKEPEDQFSQSIRKFADYLKKSTVSTT
ncbi:MAG: P-loop NTPase [Methanoregula sp.]|nr:P-loop NTPase [Methanoregula sp.]